MQDPQADLLEGVEAEFMYQYESMAPPSAVDSLGISTGRIGGGVVLAMRNDVTGYWSKALGFGFTEPVTEDLIDRVIDFYNTAESPGAVIQIAPAVLPTDWYKICERHEIREDSQWVKLACPADQFQPVENTTLRVATVGPRDVDAWARTTLQAFGMPEEGLAEMLAASASNPAFRPFAAWDGDKMVATANLFIRGDVASLNAAATLPSHQSRGAQSALIAARGKEAIKAGCRWLVAETGQPAEGASNPSLNNLTRSGLQPRYIRTNWVWRSHG